MQSSFEYITKPSCKALEYITKPSCVIPVEVHRTKLETKP